MWFNKKIFKVIQILVFFISIVNKMVFKGFLKSYVLMIQEKFFCFYLEDILVYCRYIREIGLGNRYQSRSLMYRYFVVFFTLLVNLERFFKRLSLKIFEIGIFQFKIKILIGLLFLVDGKIRVRERFRFFILLRVIVIGRQLIIYSIIRGFGVLRIICE